MKYKIINVTLLSFALTSITLYNDEKSNKINKYHQHRKYCCIYTLRLRSRFECRFLSFFSDISLLKVFFYFPKIYTHTMHSVHIVLFIRPERFGIFQFSDTFNVPSACTCVCVCVCVSHTKGIEQFVSPPTLYSLRPAYIYICYLNTHIIRLDSLVCNV